MIGIHIIADLKKIDFKKIQLTENKLRNFISKSLEKIGLTELGNHYHTFSNPDEITGVIALAESHITFHTWPEKDYISVDIFVCNIENNNSDKAKALYKEFTSFVNPGEIEEQVIERSS